MSKRALFLDRDGIINEDYGYVIDASEFVFCEGIFELVKEAIALDMLVIVVTNQSGIARGYYSEEQFLALSGWMKTQFERQNAKVDDVFYCPHHPTQGGTEYTIDCKCRKPKSGMFEQAAIKYSIDLSRSIMVGDKDSDIKAGLNAGIKTNYWLDHSASTRNIDIVNSKNATIKIINSLVEVDLTQHL
jgi:D-glycero-D-manno-heptose 1,7-bisphosphate phosphatase